MSYDLKKSPIQVTRDRTYQHYLDEDRQTPPAHFRALGDEDMGTAMVASERYTSREFYERERRMWDHSWQMTCREEQIPNVGDYQLYDICNRSYLIVRSASDTIKAYPNVCLHRGRKLRSQHGHADNFTCRFHGFSWRLDGSLDNIPCRWDFPQIEDADLALPEVKVGCWAGWVFINPDPDAIPLEDWLDPIKEHYEPYLWDQSYLGMHVGKLLKANWKVVQEAFMEGWHSRYTHPQIIGYVDDVAIQYDVWKDKPHVSRMLAVFGAASPYVAAQVTDQDVYDDFTGGVRTRSPASGSGYRLKPGELPRHVAADENRAVAEAMTGIDLSHVSDAELVDGWYYNVFPNLMHFGGYGPNMFYRFRPWNDSHEETLMEVGFILRRPKDQASPPPADFVFLDFDQPWASVEAMGDLGSVLDQDTDNMTAIQEGLKASFSPAILLGAYQEARIRHFHRTLDSYVD